MKKKQFTSKLQFQKTTVVSFNAILNVKGGALQNVNTTVVPIDTLIPISAEAGCMPTVGGCVPTTAVDNTCPPPTRNDDTYYACETGGVNNYTKKYCNDSIGGC